MNIAIFAVARAVAARLKRWLAPSWAAPRHAQPWSVRLAPSLATLPDWQPDWQPDRPQDMASNLAAPLLHVSSIAELKRKGQPGDALRTTARIGRLARAWRALLGRDAANDEREEPDAFAALEDAPVAAIVVDRQGRIMRANAQAERLFQYRRSDLAGLSADLLVPHLLGAAHAHPDALHLAAHPRAHEAARVREIRAKRRDGSVFPAEVAAREFRHGGCVATLAFVTDHTERQELKRDRQELAHLTRVSTLGELAGSLAHELNQPLTAILSNVQAAQRFIDLDPAELDEVREILKDIVDDSCRASEVIRRIRALVKKDELELVRLDPGSVLRDVVQLVHSDAIVRGVHLSLDIDDDLPSVCGDRIQLQQVVLNLLINAFDAVSDCDALERVVIAFAGLDRDGNVRVAIRDRGPGVAADHLERIFRPFVTSKAHGLGLGLSISRSIVEMHRGRLWAENNTDKGMTFYVVLPPWSGPETAR
ncbi:two-component system sensor histidine kinase NtrB [Paraburkholderia solisilvae]|uniref:histidine kinase n=1 Tax=Paraburkholderia solisilvae TaxID=624376 RepID=A0A6J5E9H9_9BURK|nr:ATP-binding protein [Paraburkholderia solisilvae]CAB3763158.1 Adaptive-response sensory-kinase SasA [Paraburkholderia solisilvae]